MFVKRFVLVISLLFTTLLTHAENEVALADDVFKFSANIDDNKVLLTWDIAPGYYLYKNKIKINAITSASLGEIVLPQAKIKHDKFFGEVEVYRNSLVLDVAILDASSNVVSFDVGYQGCADIGICYPPITKPVTLALNTLNPITTNSNNLFSLSKVNSNNFSVARDFNITNASEPLLASQAFNLNIIPTSVDTLLAIWDIKDKYYLYADKFKIDVAGAEIKDIIFPAATTKEDKFFGKVGIYKNQLKVKVLLKNIKSNIIDVNAIYQGCWEGGVCYAPQVSSIKVSFPIINEKSNNTDINTIQPQVELNATDKITHILQQQSIFWILISFFGFGLLLSFTPCVLPMIPILSSIIINNKEQISSKKAFMIAVVFVLSMSITYAIFGVIAAYFGANLQILFQTPWVLALFSFVFVILALSMFGCFEIKLPSFLQVKINNISNNQDNSKFSGTAIIGALSALVVGPCVAPPLAGALLYIGQTGDVLLGAIALFVMSLGMGVPLIVIGTGVVRLPKTGDWMNKVKYFFGVLMLAMAIWLLERIISDIVALILWALLISIAPIAMGVFRPYKIKLNFWRIFLKIIGLAVLAYGIMLWALVVRGGGDMFAPLSGWGSTVQTQQVAIKFNKVKSIAELNSILVASTADKNIVMLDFYADWCISCKVMEKYVFTNPEVVEKAINIITLQADVTENNANDKELMRHFNIVGPPAILFFKDGKELISKRIIGEINANNFLQQLDGLQ